MVVEQRDTQNPHKQRQEFLDCLAILTGYEVELTTGFPDGRYPDVLRIDQSRQRLFIGDAKDSESPGCLDTQARLLAYFRWLSVHVVGRGGQGMVAICFGDVGHAPGWIATLEALAKEAGVGHMVSGVDYFGPGFVVAWSRTPDS